MANWVELITSSNATPATASSQNASLQASVSKSDLPYLELMDSLLQILNLVLGLVGESGKTTTQGDIEKHMVAHFPFHSVRPPYFFHST
jgi:hypothetical protein